MTPTVVVVLALVAVVAACVWERAMARRVDWRRLTREDEELMVWSRVVLPDVAECDRCGRLVCADWETCGGELLGVLAAAAVDEEGT